MSDVAKAWLSDLPAGEFQPMRNHQTGLWDVGLFEFVELRQTVGTGMHLYVARALSDLLNETRKAMP